MVGSGINFSPQEYSFNHGIELGFGHYSYQEFQ